MITPNTAVSSSSMDSNTPQADEFSQGESNAIIEAMIHEQNASTTSSSGAAVGVGATPLGICLNFTQSYDAPDSPPYTQTVAPPLCVNSSSTLEDVINSTLAFFRDNLNSARQEYRELVSREIDLIHKNVNLRSASGGETLLNVELIGSIADHKTRCCHQNEKIDQLYTTIGELRGLQGEIGQVVMSDLRSKIAGLHFELDSAALAMVTTKSEYQTLSTDLCSRLDSMSVDLEELTSSSNVETDLAGLLASKTPVLEQKTSCFLCMRCVPLVVYSNCGHMHICRECCDRSKTVRCHRLLCKECDFCKTTTPLDNLIDVKSKIWD